MQRVEGEVDGLRPRPPPEPKMRLAVAAMDGVDRPGRSLALLSLLAAVCSVAGAGGCRYYETGCAGPSSCWNGGKNTTVPSDCKCCVGYPYHPRGECRRWALGRKGMVRVTSPMYCSLQRFIGCFNKMKSTKMFGYFDPTCHCCLHFQ